MVRSWALALSFILVCCSTISFAREDSPADALPELLKLYQELGLPIPPKNAKLVRYESGGVGFVNGVRQPPTFSLAFLIETQGAQKKKSLFQDVYQRSDWLPAHWDVVEPTEEAAQQTYEFRPTVSFAVQCQAMGWKKLAAEILSKCEEGASGSFRKQVLTDAWYHWQFQLSRPDIDRRPAAAMLKKIKALDPELARTFHADSLIRSLDHALVPSTAKPGSDESLVDGLVDATITDWPYEMSPSETPYQKLVRRGFDAVPVLLNHLEDDRLTRSMHIGTMMDHSYELRIYDIVSSILRQLAGSDEAKHWRTGVIGDGSGGEPLVKSDVLAWWREAQKTGEESYLVKNAAKPETERYGTRTPKRSKQSQIEIIAFKYPKNLERVYRELLEQQPVVESHPIASAIAGSTLSLDEKVRILLIGATNKVQQHRAAALWQLKQFDQKKFVALLIKNIDELSGKPTDAWMGPESQYVSLTIEADDQGVWQALLQLAKRAEVRIRLEMLHQCSYSDTQSQNRLEFLAAFLTDDTVRTVKAKGQIPDVRSDFFQFPKLEVRNAAAMVLGSLLKIGKEPTETWQARQWADYREQVRAALRLKGIEPPADK